MLIGQNLSRQKLQKMSFHEKLDETQQENISLPHVTPLYDAIKISLDQFSLVKMSLNQMPLANMSLNKMPLAKMSLEIVGRLNVITPN